MNNSILDLLRQVMAIELIVINLMAWILADLSRPRKPVRRMGDFVPIKQGRMSLPETFRV